MTRLGTVLLWTAVALGLFLVGAQIGIAHGCWLQKAGW